MVQELDPLALNRRTTRVSRQREKPGSLCKAPFTPRPENPILAFTRQIDAKNERLKELPKVQIVAAENKKPLAKESSEFRKKVRGESVGRLG